MTVHTESHARIEAMQKLDDAAQTAAIIAGKAARHQGDPEQDVKVLARLIRDLALVLVEELHR